MAESKPTKSRSSRKSSSATPAEAWREELQQLSYQDARTALELAMAQLQSSELELEQMAGLYQRAEAYADRCEQVLGQVEQDVIEWEAQSSRP